jgi:hypothetical protein
MLIARPSSCSSVIHEDKELVRFPRLIEKFAHQEGGLKQRVAEQISLSTGFDCPGRFANRKGILPSEIVARKSEHAVQLIVSRKIARLLGVGSSLLAQTFGAREVAAGLMVPNKLDTPLPLWGRVAGTTREFGSAGCRTESQQSEANYCGRRLAVRVKRRGF